MKPITHRPNWADVRIVSREHPLVISGSCVCGDPECHWTAAVEENAWVPAGKWDAWHKLDNGFVRAGDLERLAAEHEARQARLRG